MRIYLYTVVPALKTLICSQLPALKTFFFFHILQGAPQIYNYEGYIVSVHRMVMENRPVDTGSIQGSHRPISFIRINIEYARTIFCVKLSINNHIVGLVHKNHILRTRLMYHAACKVEFQPFKRLYSQLTFFNFLCKK